MLYAYPPASPLAPFPQMQQPMSGFVRSPGGALAGALSGAIFGVFAGYLAASWTGNADKQGAWALWGTLGGATAVGAMGARCSGGLDCLGAIVPAVIAGVALAPAATVTSVVRRMNKRKPTKSDNVMLGLGIMSILGAITSRGAMRDQPVRVNQPQMNPPAAQATYPELAPESIQV